MSSRRAPQGFLLPVVAVLLTAAAVLVVDALRGATIDQALAGAAREQQRGFEAAEIGLARTEHAIRAQRPIETSRTQSVDDSSRALVTTDQVDIDSLPAGFSSGRLQAQRLRVRSDGITVRGTRVSLELGLTRLQPVP